MATVKDQLTTEIAHLQEQLNQKQSQLQEFEANAQHFLNAEVDHVKTFINQVWHHVFGHDTPKPAPAEAPVTSTTEQG